MGRDAAARFVAAQARWFVFSGQLLDTLEIDNPRPSSPARTAHTPTSATRSAFISTTIFDFYRGLVGDLVTWSTATCQVPGRVDDSGTGAYRSLELSNAGSSMLRWALGIRPSGKCLESRVERLKEDGFRLQAWNRLPKARPTITLEAQDVGLPSKAEVLRVQLSGPAFRQPAEFELTGTASTLSLKASKPARVRLSYRVLRPAWPADDRPVLYRRHPDGRAEVVRGDVAWEDNWVEWQATPGEYDLRSSRE
jgi:hypothetical protein